MAYRQNGMDKMLVKKVQTNGTIFE